MAQVNLDINLLPVCAPQVFPIQQLSHDVTCDALGSISHVKQWGGCLAGCHVVTHALAELKDKRDNLQQHKMTAT